MPEPLPRGDDPFDASGVTRGPDGIARYDHLPPSVVAMVRASVERHPEIEALVEVGGERVSYAELWERAARVAGGLVLDGVGRGDRVASLLPAGLDWVVGFLGTLMAGAVAVPVNTRFAPPEVEHVLTDSGARAALRPGSPLPSGNPEALDDLVPGDLAAIFYTSGTTGRPKGARTTHRNFLSNVETAIRVTGIDRTEGPSLRNLVSVPLFHVTGCNSQLLVQLGLGGTTVVLPTFDGAAFVRTIVEERIDTLVSVPAVYGLTLARDDLDVDLSHVRRVSYGGAPIAPALVRRLREQLPRARLGNGFGLTETSSIATFLPHEWAAEHADAVGFAAPVVDLALADPDEAGVGELLIRGPNVVDGYWRAPEATAATFVDGWLHSGDLARVDDGIVRIVDRAKDVINRGGENVYSVEVENALAGAPGVTDAAVVAVPDDVMGEKVGAVLVGSGIDVDAVLSHLEQRLADFKVPQYVVVTGDPLPRNPGGKLLKRTIREGTTWGRPVRGR
ncbi:class I adenylate-forming enzyme family protein [Actinomycetospora cinnamomea]|uniref:Acyl-CoA synthetase (AMP-forming)/AMP-acid ligase II n=1 Tax=Actinomycetospora cinnamomea TaxID=663609 RepID=A0A2U1F696_9PSEU|nr:AMP-binding protein [Actinomycetospora cinnamomea]PVZ07672.1 acyl-CoA synthetase (AMP-forming)/AMP-acid ligase II [Actinomycetospora cinnamomea]